MKLLDELRDEGYEVAGAMFIGDERRPTVFSISGHGLQLHVAKDDLDTWASLLTVRRERRRRRALIERLVRVMATMGDGDGGP